MTTMLISQWGDHMRFAGAAPLTIKSRTRALRHLERDHGALAQVTREHLVTFLSPYGNASTRSTMLSYIRCFYAWANDEGHITTNPTAKLSKIKVPAGVPRPAPVEDVAAMLAAATPRVRMWGLLMAYCGLRCCEVALVRPEHLEQRSDSTWHMVIPHSKGGHRQSVSVPSWVAEELLAAEPWDVSAQTVQLRVKMAFRYVGSRCTAHQLRHYYATSALQGTGNLALVQQMMRHATPATTARYTLIVSSEASAAAEALPRVA